jgi:hypothetical protein
LFLEELKLNDNVGKDGVSDGVQEDLFPLTVSLGSMPSSTGPFMTLEQLKPGSDDPLNWSGQQEDDAYPNDEDKVVYALGQHIK